MRSILIEKVTLNIGVGKPGPELEKAMKLLEMITGSKPIQTKAKKRIPNWEIRPGLPIGCKVTLRRKKAEEMLSKLLDAIDKKLKVSNFDNEGNVAFGIREYFDIPGVKYNAEIGMMGLEAAVTFKRPGYRIKVRKIKRKKIPKKHRITKEETMKFLKEKFGVQILEEEK